MRSVADATACRQTPAPEIGQHLACRVVARGAGAVTALTFGNTNTEFWVGTSTGQVFVDLANGACIWRPMAPSPDRLAGDGVKFLKTLFA